MDEIASAVRDFKSGWERRVGPRSEFDEGLTPESRAYSRLMIDEPRVAVDALLGGVGIASAGVQGRPAVAFGPRGVAVLSLATCCATLLPYLGCSCLHAPGWVTALVIGVTSAATAAFLGLWGNGLKKYVAVKAVESPQPRLTIDPKAIQAALDAFQRMMETVAGRVRRQEEDRALGFDIADSTGFGEWVQVFVDYANGQPDNGDLRLIKRALVSQLRLGGVVVYDTLLKNPDGTQKLPPADSFQDERHKGDDEYMRVCRAAVYSRRRVLASGVLA